MMLDTADNKIYFPRFYDIDTICSYDNSGQLKFDVDIEMEQGYWNTSSSRLWTRIRDLMHDDIVTTYNDMRQNGVSYENMMHYIYDEQIAKIPQTYYNKDYDVKYAPFADSYIGMAHGDTYEHVKRWLKQRFTFVDTLFDYAPSYNNDILTIRVNTTEEITLHLETYTPVYQHLSWYNGQMDKKKIDGKTSITFNGKVQAATDQEVLIYGGSNIKKITGIQSGNPNRLILGSATKLTELDASNCPLLAEINMNKANLSPHEYLNKVNLSNCPLLEGNLRLNNSPLIQELDIRGTKITGMNLPSSIRNLQVLRLPNTMTDLTLNDAGMLHTLDFDEGIALQSVSMTNCNALENVTGLDLLQTPSITLNNSYNNVAELYFKDTTNLSLSNMSNLERVIYTPNDEYETFELINVANAPDYKITTFNCPKLSTFMTTAPYRESYMVDVEYTTEYVGQKRTILKYIQTDGTQYFTTDYIPNANTVVKADMHMTRETQYDYFFGSESFKLQLMNDNTNIKTEGMTLTPNASLDAKVAVTRQTWIATSTLVNEDTQPLCIFCGFYINKLEPRFKGIGKLYSFKIYENEVLLHDYEPCLDNKGVVCLYDKVVDNFLYASDGVLIPGNIVKVIDNEYVEVPHREHGDIQPNTTFTANSIDISNTQFTDVKLLCTTDTNTLKLPTTVKNFYCDSSFDLDTDYLEDGEYDVVHGELVEQYTTDYEGEVVRFSNNEASLLIKDICTIPTSYIHEERGEAMYHPSYSLSDFIEVVSSTRITLNFWVCRVSEYNADKSYIKQTVLYDNGTQTLILDSSCKYIRVHVEPFYSDDINVITYTPLVTYVPNLIPSSADGSIIMSMYAPSNTVAPASGTWDLKGLEFDNFHTFGMNNDMSGGITIKTVIEADENGYMRFDKNIKEFDVEFSYTRGSADAYANYGHILLYKDTNVMNAKNPGSISVYANHVAKPGSTGNFFNLTPSLSSGKSANMRFHFDGTNITVYRNEVEQGVIPYSDLYANLGYNQYADGVVHVYKYHDNITSYVSNVRLTYTTENPLTMPARYDDYNIAIKNAHISPKTHNTMLYPLLVNEDNPITGTLDYTNYAGKHLSWSFAYTDEEYVNIIQPKEELINSYEYRYNAFYDTEYEFENPYEIARYTSSASGVLPSFNAEFTYTYDEIDNGDGTYTTKIYADSLDNLPTNMSFYTKSALLSVEHMNVSKVTSTQGMFYQCTNVTYINSSNWDTSSVTNMSNMFNGCTRLTSLDVSGFVTSNVTNMANIFSNCKNLTSLDVSGFVTSNVTSMYEMFRNCTSLTSLDLSGFDTSNVTNMYRMFQGCKSLTSLDLSGFDTSNVINMNNIFQDCSGLTSLNISGLDTSKIDNMTYMFDGCTGLTSLDLSGFDTGKVTKMFNMFTNCIKLTSLDLSSFDTGEVTNMSCMFQSCPSLTSLDLSSFNTGNVTDMLSMFRGCTSLTSLNLSGFDTSNVKNMASMFRDCSGLTSLDLSGLDTSNVTNMGEMFYNCNQLTSLDVSGFDTTNVTNMSSMFRDCKKLTSLDVSGFDTSKVTLMNDMFVSCIGLTSIDVSGFDTSEVTSMASMFNACNNLTSLDLSGFDTSKVTDMNMMFRLCNNLTSLHVESWSLDNINTIIPQLSVSPSTSTLYGSVVIDETKLPTGWTYKFDNVLEIARYTASASGMLPTFNDGFTGYNVTEVNNSNNTYTVSIMTDSLNNLPTSISFYKKSELLTVNKLNTKNVTDMTNMFRNCSGLTSLDSNGFNTSKVTSMKNMFNNCSGLTSLDLSGFDTSNVTDMTGMITNCNNLTSLNLSGFNTSKVTNMSFMFRNCNSLTSLDLSGFNTSNVNDMSFMFNSCSKLASLNLSGFDIKNVTEISNMFAYCNSLIELDSMQNISMSLDLSYTILDVTSLLDVINNLATVSTSKTLKIGSTLLSKLTEEQIAIAVNKGWTVS